MSEETPRHDFHEHLLWIFYGDANRMHAGCYVLADGIYVSTGIPDPLKGKPRGWRPRWWVQKVHDLTEKGVIFKYSCDLFSDDSEDPPELDFWNGKYEEAMRNRRIRAER